jgi:hypothetical protein
MAELLVRLRARLRDDRGQIMLLSIGFAVVAIALVLVVTAVSAIYLERKQLLALADAMAADAADAIDEEAYFGEDRPGAPAIPLTDASVQAATQDYLEAAPEAVIGDFRALQVVAPTGTPNGTTAQVTLSAVVRPPVVGVILSPWQDGFAIVVTAQAEAL